MELISFTNLIMVGLQKLTPYTSQIADLILLTCLILVVFVIYQQGSRFAYKVPTFLTSLGIIGAILSVSISLSAFDVHNIQTSLPLFLNGLRIAIFISIMTMLSAILVKAINNRRREVAQEKGVSNTITPTMIYLVLREISEHNAEQKAILSNMAEQAQESQQNVQKLLELQQGNFVQQVSLLEDLKRSLTGKEEGSLANQLQKIHIQFEDGLHRVQQISTKGFEELTAEFHTLSERLTVPSLIQAFNESNHSMSEQFNENAKQLTQVVNTLSTWQNQSRDQLAYSQEGLEKSRDALQEMVTHLQTIPQTMEQLSRLVQGLGQQLEETELYLESFQPVKLFQGMQQEIQRNLNLVETSLETQLDMAESSLETQLEGFMALQEGFAKLENQTRSTAEKWQTDMSEILTRFTTEIHQATDQFVINSPGEKAVRNSTVAETNTTETKDRQDTFLEKEYVEQKLKTTAMSLANLSNLEDEKDFQSQSEQDDYWQNRGYGLMETGNYQEAINYFDKAIELKPKEFALFYNKACCYALVGRADLATVTLRQAISLNPESREMAKTDSDFDDARHSPKFQSLLQNGAFNGQTA